MNDEQLIKRLREKLPDKDTSSFNYLDFLHSEGSPLSALFYSRLFWPEFVEFNGMIFFKETIEDNDDIARVNKTFEKYGFDRTKTEKSFNLVEISSLFGRRIGESTVQEDEILINRLAEMWKCCLRYKYPDQDFVVEILSPEETGGDIGIIFYQGNEGE